MNLTEASKMSGWDACLIAVIISIVVLVIFFSPALYRKLKKGLKAMLEGGAHF